MQSTGMFSASLSTPLAFSCCPRPCFLLLNRLQPDGDRCWAQMKRCLPLLAWVCSSCAVTLFDGIRSLIPHIPDIWGGNATAPAGGVLQNCSGFLFGFSGLDGPTHEAVPFVAIKEGETPDSFRLRFCGLSRNFAPLLTVANHGTPTAQMQTRIATNDVLLLAQPDDQNDLVLTWIAGNTMVAQSPSLVTIQLENSTAIKLPSNTTETCWLNTQVASAFLVLCSSSFPSSPIYHALAMGSNPADATATARQSLLTLSANAMASIVSKRLEMYRLAPQVASASLQQLLFKALSVMRVNALAPEGLILQRWSTPDRSPHQYMWLWDSCYHSMGLNEVTVAASPSKQEPGHIPAWEYLKSVLDAAGPNGGVAIERTPNSAGGPVDQTQPPLLAWAVYENYLIAKETDAAAALSNLQWAFPRLESYIMWDLFNRSHTEAKHGTPLATYFWIKGTESGMDNSIRFDVQPDARDMYALDFAVFAAREMQFLEQIAAELNETDRSQYWKNQSSVVRRTIHATMWDASRKIYVDVWTGPERQHTYFSPVLAVTSFLPLWLPDTPADRVASLLQHLANVSTFATAASIPSVSIRTLGFSTDMWRGPMWINTNYHVVLALAQRGLQAEAVSLAMRTISIVEKYYLKFGVVFEFYDSLDAEDPRSLLRKGVRTGGVRDYHWTAALTLKLIIFVNGTSSNAKYDSRVI